MVITNAKLIAEDGDKTFQVWATCVQTIMAACSLWSPIRLSEQQAAVVVALQRVRKVALAVDLVCMALLTRHTKALLPSTADSADENNCGRDAVQDLPFRQNTRGFLTLMQDADSERVVLLKSFLAVDTTFEHDVGIPVHLQGVR